jgi:hypothetical protein
MIRAIRSFAFVGLIVLALFNALSAFGGGVAVVVTNGLGMPMSQLGGAFDSFLIPGIVLFVIVGGTQLIAGALLLRRRESGLLWSAIAGCGMVVWIFVEVMIIGGGAWLQTLYFVTGLAQLLLVIALLGVVAWLPREALARPVARP